MPPTCEVLHSESDPSTHPHWRLGIYFLDKQTQRGAPRATLRKGRQLRHNGPCPVPPVFTNDCRSGGFPRQTEDGPRQHPATAVPRPYREAPDSDFTEPLVVPNWLLAFAIAVLHITEPVLRAFAVLALGPACGAYVPYYMSKDIVTIFRAPQPRLVIVAPLGLLCPAGWIIGMSGLSRQMGCCSRCPPEMSSGLQSSPWARVKACSPLNSWSFSMCIQRNSAAMRWSRVKMSLSPSSWEASRVTKRQR